MHEIPCKTYVSEYREAVYDTLCPIKFLLVLNSVVNSEKKCQADYNYTREAIKASLRGIKKWFVIKTKENNNYIPEVS